MPRRSVVKPGLRDPPSAAQRGLAGVRSPILPTVGHPLEPALQSELSATLGHDFSMVRVHADASAARVAQQLGAAAFTAGEHVAFALHRFDPATAAGRRLLVHEMAHVVQQQRASAIVPGVGSPDAAAEHAAERAAAGDTSLLARRDPVSSIQRAPTGLPDKPAGATIGGEELEVEITAFLQRALTAQGGQRLVLTEQVKQGLRSLTVGNPNARLRIDLLVDDPSAAGTPASLASRVLRALPPSVDRRAVDALRDAKVSASGPPVPASAAEALGAAVERGVRDLVKWLPKDAQDAIVDAAKSSVADGVTAAIQAAVKQSKLDGPSQNAVVKAVEGFIKQRQTPASAPPRSDDRFVREQAPSVEPAKPSVKDENITTSPSVKTPGTPGRPDVKPPASLLPPGLEASIASFDSSRLVPRGPDGKPADGSFADAKQFARDVYDELVTAQRDRRVAVVVLPGEYDRPGLSMPDVFDEAERIVRNVATKAPGGAARVDQVTIQIRNRANVRRIVRLRETQ
jgi:hypothetical protein